MSDEQKMPEVVEDGFGGRWVKCKARQCGLHVVRPGKVQCDCDYDPTGKIEMLESTIATLTAERDALVEAVKKYGQAMHERLRAEAVDENGIAVIENVLYDNEELTATAMFDLAAQLKEAGDG